MRDINSSSGFIQLDKAPEDAERFDGWFMTQESGSVPNKQGPPPTSTVILSELAHFQHAESMACDITPIVLGPWTGPNLGACKLLGKLRSSLFHDGYERSSVPISSKPIEQ